MSALHLNAYLKVESKTKNCKPFSGEKGGGSYLKVFFCLETTDPSLIKKRAPPKKSTKLFKMFLLNENTKAVIASVTQCNSRLMN